MVPDIIRGRVSKFKVMTQYFQIVFWSEDLEKLSNYQ